MKAVTSTDQLLANVLCDIDAKRGPQTLYESLRDAATLIGEDPEDLPDSAYEAATAFVRVEIMKLAQSAVKQVEDLFESIEKLPAAATEAQIAKLKKKAKIAHLPYMFQGALTKTALDAADFEYIAERVIDAGKEAIKKRESAEA